MTDLLQHISADLASLSAIIAMIGGAMTYVYRKIVRPVEMIRQEFRPNGGGSLSDRVDNIATTQVEHGHRLRVIERKTTLSGSKSDLILDDLECGYAYMDATGCNRQVNKIFCLMMKTDRDSLMRYGWKTHVSPEEHEAKKHFWEGAFKDERNVEFPLTMIPTGGEPTEYWIHIMWTTIPDRFMATIRPIAEATNGYQEID